MTKMRVHELAKELGMENKALIEALEKRQIEVKSHMSSLEESVVADLKKELGNKKIKRNKMGLAMAKQISITEFPVIKTLMDR